MTTKPDYQSVVKALESMQYSYVNLDEEWCCSDCGVLRNHPHEDYCGIGKAILLARSMVEKLEHYDELVEAKDALEWLNNNERHVFFRAVENKLDCPAIIKKMIGEGK